MKKLILVLALAASNAIQAQPTTHSSDILTSWMMLHSKMVRSAKGIAHVAYSRHFAYTATAVYESIVAADPSFRSLNGQLNGLSRLPSVPKQKLFFPASLNSAYASMLRHFYSSFGSCGAVIDSMEAVQRKFFLSQNIEQKQMNLSEAYGRSVADTVIKWSQTDNSNTAKDYIPLQQEGMWTPATSAAAPFWYENRSFTNNLFTSVSFIPPVYSTDTTSHFYKMVKEVYTTSIHLTPEQKATALYWDDSPNGQYMTVFGHWTSIAANLIKKRQLSLINAAEAYAKMAISMYEASLLSWKGKYQYAVLRPVNYIQKHMDPKWSSLIVTPNHPEFPAAHATLSNAAAMALCSLFGEACAVSDNSYVDIGMKERSYSSLQEMAKEAGYSRLYGGIHYAYSIEQGFSIGAAAAKHVDSKIHFR